MAKVLVLYYSSWGHMDVMVCSAYRQWLVGREHATLPTVRS